MIWNWKLLESDLLPDSCFYNIINDGMIDSCAVTEVSPIEFVRLAQAHPIMHMRGEYLMEQSP